MPSKTELFKVLKSANLNAAAGSDEIYGLVFKECWNTIGDCLRDVSKAIISGSRLPTSMRTAMRIFCPKPKKSNSLKPSDKRHICVLNCDFKLYEGLLARRFCILTLYRAASDPTYLEWGERNQPAPRNFNVQFSKTEQH